MLLEPLSLDNRGSPMPRRIEQCSVLLKITSSIVSGRGPHTSCKSDLDDQTCRNWNSLQPTNNTPTLSGTGNDTAPSARIDLLAGLVICEHRLAICAHCVFGEVRAVLKRVRIFNLMDALETSTPKQHKRPCGGPRPSPAEK